MPSTMGKAFKISSVSLADGLFVFSTVHLAYLHGNITLRLIYIACEFDFQLK